MPLPSFAHSTGGHTEPSKVRKYFRQSFKGLRKVLRHPRALFAPTMAVAAFGVSVTSLYFSSFEGPRLAFFPARMLEVGIDPVSRYEYFSIPLTLINTGGSTGTVVYFLLEVTHIDSKKLRSFESVYVLQNGRIIERFKPIAVSANSSASKDIGFYPTDRAVRDEIATETGTYQLSIRGISAHSASEIVESTFFFVTPADKDDLLKGKQDVRGALIRTARTRDTLDEAPSRRNVVPRSFDPKS